MHAANMRAALRSRISKLVHADCGAGALSAFKLAALTDGPRDDLLALHHTGPGNISASTKAVSATPAMWVRASVRVMA